MTNRRWNALSGKAQLAVAIVSPAAILVIASAALLFWVTRADVNEGLRARGTVIAAALAESAQYDLIQGNKAAARRSMQNLVTSDPTIKQITLLDGQRAPVLSYGDPPRGDPFTTIELPMFIVDSRLSDPIANSGPSGYVRVLMSSRSLDDAQTSAWLTALGVLAIAMLASLATGWVLLQKVNRPIASAQKVLNDIQRGNVDVQGAAVATGGLWAIQSGALAAAHVVSEAKRELQLRHASEKRELQAAVASAVRADRDKQRLIMDGERMVEAERERIAGDIHDTLNASLIEVRLWAEAIVAKATGDEPADLSSLAQMARRIVSTTDGLYHSTRSIVRQLRPELLDTLGLPGALEEMVRRLDETHQSCRFEFLQTEPSPQPPAAAAIAAFRVTQEALSNVVKHSGADKVVVTLEAVEPPRHLRLVIADNGQGIDTGAAGAGLGMIGMRERVAAAGGVLSVASEPTGTVVTVLL